MLPRQPYKGGKYGNALLPLTALHVHLVMARRLRHHSGVNEGVWGIGYVGCI
jgi:hypothetical protein